MGPLSKKSGVVKGGAPEGYGAGLFLVKTAGKVAVGILGDTDGPTRTWKLKALEGDGRWQKTSDLVARGLRKGGDGDGTLSCG